MNHKWIIPILSLFTACLFGAAVSLTAMSTVYHEIPNGVIATGNQGQALSTSYSSQVNINEIYDLVNEKRKDAQLRPLTRSAKLDASAKAKCDHMVANNYWSHFAPDGTSPWYFITNTGYSYSTAGENLAKDFNTPRGIINGWMSSEGHKANILNSDYIESGMAGCNGLDNQPDVVIVQHFAKPL